MRTALIRRRGLALAAAVLAVFAGACGATGPTATPTHAATRVTAVPAVPAVPASRTPSPVASIASSVPDPALEARLPATLNGVALARASFTGASIVSNPDASAADLVGVLTTLGKTPNDLSEAFASDASDGLKVTLGAIRIAGADGNAALAAFVAANQRRLPTLSTSQATLAGKAVTEISNPSEPLIGLTYVYARGDTLFFVTTPDRALAVTALGALP